MPILARERGWPHLRHLAFADCWSWLEGELPYHLELAEEPHHRALFTLLNVCAPGVSETDMILHVAQVLEAFFTDKRQGITSVLRQRLELVLGEPSTHQNWFNRFYERRSRIAHGSAPVLRPGSYAHEDHPEVADYIKSHWEPLDEALAVFMAVLQDLVIHNAREYVFLQEALRLPRLKPGAHESSRV